MTSMTCTHCGQAVSARSMSRDDHGRLSCRHCAARSFLEQYARVAPYAGVPTPSALDAVDRSEHMAIVTYLARKYRAG